MMFSVISKVLGLLLMLFSLTLVPPALVSFWYHDQAHLSFILAFAITLATGLVLWFPAARVKNDLRTRDGFLITSLFWVVLALFGSLPFVFDPSTDLSFIDAMFESLSGLTTTGATVITGLEHLPASILFYRQQLQWLGGIGIIVIAVAILPMLGIGGMQLYRAETPGPVKDSKLTPRITETAKALFLIYLSITVACALAYWVAGMSIFDAVCHSFATVAIGGFSTYDDSIGHFQSPAIMLVCMFFMLVSAVNFALHFTVWHNRKLSSYFYDPECRFYICVAVIGCIITSAYLYFSHVYTLETSLLKGSFELISIMTTTGFGVADFSIWPGFLPFMLFMSAFMGGCAGSTGGGVKAIRVILIFKQGMREIHRLIHPNAVFPIKLGSTTVSNRVIEAVWGFFAVYIIAYLGMTLAVMATDSQLDFVTAYTAVGACINNLGPGLGKVAAHYGELNSASKSILCFAMILGRLEVFTFLVLLTPAFWRK